MVSLYHWLPCISLYLDQAGLGLRSTLHVYELNYGWVCICMLYAYIIEYIWRSKDNLQILWVSGMELRSSGLAAGSSFTS